MASKRQYITAEECQKCNGEIKEDLKTIKTALIGEDFRGGLVYQITEMKSTLTALIQKTIDSTKQAEKDKVDKQKSSTRWKITAITIATAFGGILFGALLDLLFHIH